MINDQVQQKIEQKHVDIKHGVSSVTGEISKNQITHNTLFIRKSKEQ